MEVSYSSSSSEKSFTHPGFLIEHKNQLAARLGLQDVAMQQVGIAQLEPTQAALVSLFFYFAGGFSPLDPINQHRKTWIKVTNLTLRVIPLNGQ